MWGGTTTRSHVGAPTAVQGARLNRVVQSINLWIGAGVVGSIGVAVLGTRIGAIPRPGDTRWWFHVPGGVSAAAQFGFYVSVALLIGGWVGVGYHARGSAHGPAVVADPRAVGPAPAGRPPDLQP